MANKVLLVAVNGEERSMPFSVYATKEDHKLPNRFAMLLESSTSAEGMPEARLSNVEHGLIRSNTQDYTDKLLTGFRRKQEDRVFVIVEPFSDNIPAVSVLNNAEVF